MKVSDIENLQVTRIEDDLVGDDVANTLSTVAFGQDILGICRPGLLSAPERKRRQAQAQVTADSLVQLVTGPDVFVAAEVEITDPPITEKPITTASDAITTTEEPITTTEDITTTTAGAVTTTMESVTTPATEPGPVTDGRSKRDPSLDHFEHQAREVAMLLKDLVAELAALGR